VSQIYNRDPRVKNAPLLQEHPTFMVYSCCNEEVESPRLPHHVEASSIDVVKSFEHCPQFCQKVTIVVKWIAKPSMSCVVDFKHQGSWWTFFHLCSNHDCEQFCNVIIHASKVVKTLSNASMNYYTLAQCIKLQGLA